MNGALLGATSLLRWAPGAVINRITQGHRRSVTRGRETWSVLGIMLATRAGSARFLKSVSRFNNQGSLPHWHRMAAEAGNVALAQGSH